MSLINNNTKWVLFLAASIDPEERHVMDLVFGLQCLELQKINSADIFIYIDGKDRQLLTQLLALGSNNTYQIKESKDFFTDQANNTHENMVMFITGHGSIQGIDAPIPITPYSLLQTIKGSQGLKQAVIYLTQCYAGIFNYISAGRKSEDEPNIVIIGATSLHESISSSTQETFLNGPIPWVANLFLLHIFKWLSKPIDVDGDGKTTVIDSYKYAGVMSNNANKDLKMGTLWTCIDLHPQWSTAQAAHKKSPDTQTQLTIDALSTRINHLLNMNHIHQECWILNAIPAQEIEF